MREQQICRNTVRPIVQSPPTAGPPGGHGERDRDAIAPSTKPAAILAHITRIRFGHEREGDQRRALGPLRGDEQDADDRQQDARGQDRQREHVAEDQFVGLAKDADQGRRRGASGRSHSCSQNPARVSTILRSSTRVSLGNGGFMRGTP